MKKLKLFKNLRFEQGSNRFVIVLKNIVIKFPKNFLGISANLQEYKNYQQTIKYVAKTKKIFFVLLQERLTDIQIFPLDLLQKDFPEYALPLLAIKLNNRLQIGKDKNNIWKIFDYEDVKFFKNL